MKTLDEYLKENHSAGIIDHAIRANVDEKGRISFYIHPHGRDGETLDFWVGDNVLWEQKGMPPDVFLTVMKDAQSHFSANVEKPKRALS